jgi:hypothetical protein
VIKYVPILICGMFGNHQQKHTKNMIVTMLNNGARINLGHRSGTHLPTSPVKENKMFTNRYSKISTGLLILVVAFVSVSFITRDLSLTGGAVTSRVGSNTYLPLPPGKQTHLYNVAREARILYHRHPSKNSSISAAVYSDYFERHPELSNLAALGLGASDYAERHPELSAKASSSVDMTDYYFRHLPK